MQGVWYMTVVDRTEHLIEISGLKKYFPIEKGFLKRVIGYIKAVDDISFAIRKGETFGLVGESGCGKTTLGRCVLRAIEPTSGKLVFRKNTEQIDITELKKEELRAIRKDVQMIFQDPYSSLDPRMTVYDIISEPIYYGNVARGRELDERVKYIAGAVGLNIAHLKRYPHAFSGGQRQRIGIARALATNPSFIVADEPVSALDVSIQAQILNLMQNLQKEFHLTYLFISHDLSVIEHISQRIAIMYVGKMMELAPTKQLYANPKHPYTEALLSAVPNPDPRRKMKRIILSGEVPNPANPPSGCYFHPRCRYSEDICKKITPELVKVEDGRYSTCHFAQKLELKGVIY
jgi:peptide/nickel transport system ATP-binding protein